MKSNSEISSDQLYTMQTLKTPSAGRRLARVLLGMAGVFLVILFVPWQQNIRGTGKVTAFNQSNRPQSVESAIAGRIQSWNVREGQFVHKGDTILTLSEIKTDYFDPELLTRLGEQLEAKEMSIQSKQQKVDALRAQIDALRTGLNVKQQQISNKIRQSELKVVSDSVDYEAEKVRIRNAENQFERNKKLYEAGNIALTKFQELETKLQEARMKVVSSKNKLLQSKAELINTRVELSASRAEYTDKISKAESELNSTRADLFESQASLAKLRNENANITIRNQQYQVIAPQSGFIVRAVSSGIGETIKEGDAVATIAPSNPDIAVEMYVKAMDVPLLSRGRKARIEFDGWPALQFSGWPNVSVGSFGGIVQVIDNVNNQGNLFRILVTPDPEDEPWPEQLRIGSGTKGWVMLENVPIWYEIWRQLNGFPPSLYTDPAQSSGKPKELTSEQEK